MLKAILKKNVNRQSVSVVFYDVSSFLFMLYLRLHFLRPLSCILAAMFCEFCWLVYSGYVNSGDGDNVRLKGVLHGWKVFFFLVRGDVILCLMFIWHMEAAIY